MSSTIFNITFGWVILADPEGNEFCVEISRAERDADRAARGLTRPAEQRSPAPAQPEPLNRTGAGGLVRPG